MDRAYTEGKTVLSGNCGGAEFRMSILSKRCCTKALTKEDEWANPIFRYHEPFALDDSGLLVVGFQPTTGNHIVVKGI